MVTKPITTHSHPSAYQTVFKDVESGTSTAKHVKYTQGRVGESHN